MRLAELNAADVVAHHPDILLLISQDGRVLDANQLALDAYGYSLDEIRELRVSDIRAVDSQDSIHSQMEHALETGNHFQTNHRRSSGEVFPVDVNSFPVTLDGETALMSIIVDITETSRANLAEKRLLRVALEESEARYKTVFESISDGFVYFRVLHDDDGKPADWVIVDANRAFREHIGMDEAEGKRLRELDPDVERNSPGLFEAGCRVALSGETEEFETKGRLGRWMQVAISALDGEHIVVITHDIEERKVNEEALSRTTRALKALSRVNEAVVRAQTEDELLTAVCEPIVHDAGYALAWVGYAQDDESSSVIPMKVCGDESGYVAGLNLTWSATPRGHGTTGRAIRERKPVVMRRMGSDSDHAPWVDMAVEAGFRASMSLPLTDSDGSVFGALSIYSTDPESFDVEEVALLSEMAEDLSYGMDSLRSREQRTAMASDLLRTNDRLEGLLKEVTETMGRVVEARDPYTQGHQMGVAKLSRLIAEEMGLPEEDIDAIEIAALVHDLGKLAVPAEILTKPGGLSATEFALIKQHSQAGYDILKDIDFGSSVADIALQHHERMDGSGYPQGLCGDEIALAARVVAVADVVEAMASHRPYRPALGLDAAVSEVQKHPEKFDSAVVSACSRLYEAGQIEL